jgi:hypothetical protein
LSQLALGKDGLSAELLAEQLRGGGAAQPVIDRSGRDDGEGKAEAGVAQAGAGGAQEARLGAQQVEALQQAALDADGDAAICLGASHPEVGHHVVDGNDAVAPDEVDQRSVTTSLRCDQRAVEPQLSLDRCLPCRCRRHRSYKTKTTPI